jgi:hypothetical protein
MPNCTCDIQAIKPANMKNSPWAKLITPVALLTHHEAQGDEAVQRPRRDTAHQQVAE